MNVVTVKSTFFSENMSVPIIWEEKINQYIGEEPL